MGGVLDRQRLGQPDQGRLGCTIGVLRLVVAENPSRCIARYNPFRWSAIKIINFMSLELHNDVIILIYKASIVGISFTYGQSDGITL